MKSLRLSFCPFLIFLFGLNFQIFSQELAVQNYIGKSLDIVINNFGKPVHKDLANKSMQCVFYKTNTYQYVFVADNEGVYQAEATLSFDRRSTAMSRMNEFITNCMNQGMKTDTLGVTDFNIICKGARVDLTLFENKYSKQYQIKVKANRSED